LGAFKEQLLQILERTFNALTTQPPPPETPLSPLFFLHSFKEYTLRQPAPDILRQLPPNQEEGANNSGSRRQQKTQDDGGSGSTYDDKR
jgi:hypothetical protein